MKKLEGFYRGIVVQNNDPEKLGRVKLFIPHIHMSLLNLEENNDYDKNLYFSEFGKNLEKPNDDLIDMTKYIEEIKPQMPWAEVSLPISGGGFSSYNANSQLTNLSDNPPFLRNILGQGGSVINEIASSLPIGAFFQNNPPIDNFLSTPYDNSQALYGSPKGIFGIPSVNTKVWLFFIDGNPNSPVVFGYCPSNGSYKEVYKDGSYPAGYENDANSLDQERKNKLVTKYKGGSLTINGTSYKEEVNLSHDSGSYTKFNNFGKTNLTTGQDRSLVMGDKYTSVAGTQHLAYGDGLTMILGPFSTIANFASGVLQSLTSSLKYFIPSTDDSTNNNETDNTLISNDQTLNQNIANASIAGFGSSKRNPISIRFSDIPNNGTKNKVDYVGRVFKNIDDNKFYKIV